jgi:hypothetical protein
MDNALAVKKKIPSSISFSLPLSTQFFFFEVMIISIQKITVLFVDCTRSCMLHCSYLVKEFVVADSNVDDVTRIACSGFFCSGIRI